MLPARFPPAYRKGATMPESFTTSTGVELILKRISPLLVNKAQASVIFPERPTYEAETVSGEIEIHEHDKTTLETEEDHEAWRQYLMEYMRAEQLQNERLTNVLLRRGIDYDALQLPEDEGWIEEQQDIFGIEVPEDPFKRKMHWLETEAFTTTEEIEKLIIRLMAMTGVDEEVLTAAERSFRRPLEGDTAGEADDQGGSVELQHGLSGDEGEAGVGGDA